MNQTAGFTFPDFRFQLPGWVSSVLPAPDHIYRTDEEKMRLAIALARENVRNDTGGPFGAAVFNRDTGRLIAPGVNIVVPARWSGGHAEMVAYALAQQVLETHDLGGEDMPFCELFTSTEPCSMCLGATPWSGVRRVVCAARDEDARAAGFDEGPKPADWSDALEQRGISVARDLLREEAIRVLQDYVQRGKPIYNARQKS
ncbi:nucleoside deaminase [Balneolales bacterium ANBcel1]|nr:nucleoside deaminase [Balneolales bacterium ANBcel1]